MSAFAMVAVIATVTAISSATDKGAPTPPSEYVPPAFALPHGFVHRPASSRQLSSLLRGSSLNGHALRRGDVIELAAGTTYTGNFSFPELGTGTGWVYVVSSSVGALPPPGTRIRDSDIPNMATIKGAPGGLAAGIAFAADHYRFVGIRFLSGQTAGQTQYGIFGTGYNGANTGNCATHAPQLPSDIIIDRCIIRGRGGFERDNWGIEMNAVGMAVLDSVIDQIQDDSGADATGIHTWMGGRQYLVENCKLVASGENFMAGGTPALFGAPPSDFVFRRDYFCKLLSWNESDPSYDRHLRAIKNLFELKNAKRVLVEACIMENCWENYRSAGHHGDAFVLTPRNGGADERGSVCVSDVEIRDCLIRNVETAFRIANADDLWMSQPLARVWFHDNLAYNLAPWIPRRGYLLWLAFNNRFGSGASQQATGLRLTHNTLLEGPRGSLTYYNTAMAEGPVMMNGSSAQDNIFQGNTRGTAVYPAGSFFATFDHNAVFREFPNTYPPGNWTNLAQSDIGFVNYDGEDFALRAGSPYATGGPRQASDRRNLGADIATIKKKTAGVAK